jgi:TolA-binding protein
MSLNKLKGQCTMMRQHWFMAVVLFTFILVGCGSTEETTQDQSQAARPADKGAPAEQPKVQTAQPAQPAQSVPPPAKPQVEANSTDQALTSFIGAPEPEQKTEHPAAPVVAQSELAQYEKQIQDLRTENTGLKQKIVKLEEDNRSLASLMSDLEAKLAAEKERADHAVAAQAAPAPAAAPVTVGNPSAALGVYEDGLKTFNKRKYTDAMQAFNDALAKGISEDLRDNCIYWIGESEFALKKYSDALKKFQDVIAIKSSDKKGDAQFMIGQTYEKLGNKKKAKTAYEKVVKEYPMSKNVKHAKERWAKL